MAGQQWSFGWVDILPYSGWIVYRQGSTMVGLFRPMGCSVGGNHRYCVGDIRGIRRRNRGDLWDETEMGYQHSIGSIRRDRSGMVDGNLIIDVPQIHGNINWPGLILFIVMLGIGAYVVWSEKQ